MKKLLTILAMALVLCLALGAVALADSNTKTLNYSWSEDGTYFFTYVNGVYHRYNVDLDWDHVVTAPKESESGTTNGVIGFTCSQHADGDPEYEKGYEFVEVPVIAGHAWPEESLIKANLDEDGKPVAGNKVVKEYKAPTCTEDGYAVVYCLHQNKYLEMGPNHVIYGADKGCSATLKITLKATGHVWSAEDNDYWAHPDAYKVIKEPTCTDAGELKAYCLVCGATRDVDPIIPSGMHKWTYTDEWVTTTPATCIAEGEAKTGWYCSVCKKFAKDLEDTIHWSNSKKLPKDQKAHKFGEWLVQKEEAATCEKAGYKDSYRICTLCLDAKETKHEDIKALGHLKSGDKKNTKKVLVKGACNTEEVYNEICGRCGKYVVKENVIGKKDPKNHEDVILAEYSKKATCTQPKGIRYYCRACKTNYWEIEEPALGHDWQVTDEFDNEPYACYNISYKCSRCDMTKDEARKENEIEHRWSAWEERNKIGEGGNPGYWIRVCTRCGKTQERKAWTAPTACDDGKGHDYETVTEVKATLTASGYKVEKCKVCGDVKTTILKQLTSLTKIESFVARCYDKILGRDATATEINAWATQLEDGTKTAADIVNGFVNSQEFLNSGKDVVKALYNAMLGREITKAGEDADWQNYKKAGVSNSFLVNGFAGSEEFAKLCKDYEIEAGHAEEQIRDRNTRVTAFVNRCYDKALGRAGEQDGLNYWVSMLMDKTMDPHQVAYGFVFSVEFDAEKKIADKKGEDVVKALYGLYLGREGSAEEVKWYADQLKDGTMTLEQLNASFSYSPEFLRLVDTYGLNPAL